MERPKPIGRSRRRGLVCGGWSLVAMLGCGGATAEAPTPAERSSSLPSLAETYGGEEADTGEGDEGDRAATGRWPAASSSPQPLRAVAGPDAALYRFCGTPERGLALTASRVLERRMSDEPPFAPRQLELLLRARGVPQVWPRVLTVAGLADGAELQRRIERWAAAAPVRGQRRCGIARGADRAGRPLVAVVTVDALADLSPLPTRARSSRWLDLQGQLHVPADAVHVLLLGPSGRPRKVPASLTGRVVRSRFSLDRPGTWVVQVLASLASGPLPVLEARVFVDAEPRAALADPPAPGQPVGLPATAAPAALADALVGRVDTVRRLEGLSPLERDPLLDLVAAEHAAHMAQQRRLAHDLGRGTVEQRLTAAGHPAVHVGENVAAARTVDRAFAALWASPSHRNNLLAGGFARIGGAVAADEEGTLWVALVFSE